MLVTAYGEHIVLFKVRLLKRLYCQNYNKLRNSGTEVIWAAGDFGQKVSGFALIAQKKEFGTWVMDWQIMAKQHRILS